MVTFTVDNITFIFDKSSNDLNIFLNENWFVFRTTNVDLAMIDSNEMIQKLQTIFTLQSKMDQLNTAIQKFEQLDEERKCYGLPKAVNNRIKRLLNEKELYAKDQATHLRELQLQFDNISTLLESQRKD